MQPPSTETHALTGSCHKAKDNPILLGITQGPPLDSLKTPFFPHLFGAVVGVTASAVPVASHWFGVQSSHNPKVLADTVEDEPSHPEVIPHLDAFTWAHLEFPLEGASGCTGEDRQVCAPPAITSLLPPRPGKGCQPGVQLSFIPWEPSMRMKSIKLSNRTALAGKTMGINCS